MLFAHQHLHQGINCEWIYLKPSDQKSFIPAIKNKLGYSGFSSDRINLSPFTKNKLGHGVTTKKKDIYLVYYLCIFEMILRYNTLDNIGPYFIRS